MTDELENGGSQEGAEDGQVKEPAKDENEGSGDGGGEGSAAGGEEAKPATPPKKTAQERIDELTRLRREAEREREYWRRVALEKSEAKPATEKPAAQEVAIPSLPARPKLQDFETTEAYEDALVDWKLEVREKRQEAEKATQERQRAQEAFQKEADKIRAEYDDFDDVIARPVFSDPMKEAILASKMGPMLAYHLGRPENQALSDAIRMLSPSAQILEIGKIEANLTLAQKTRKPTDAVKPINPVGGAGVGSVLDESKMSDDDWYKLQKQKRLEALKKKYGG